MFTIALQLSRESIYGLLSTVIEIKELHPKKIALPMFFTDPGIVIDCNLEHPSNALNIDNQRFVL